MINQSLGRSKFLIAFLSSLIVGIFFDSLIPLDLWWSVGILIGLIFVSIIWWKESLWRLIFFILIGLTVGISYFNFYDMRQRAISLPYGEELSIQVPIIGHPDFSGSQAQYVLKYEKTKIQLVTGRYPEYQYGDILSLKGVLKKPNDYLFHRGILGVIYNPEELQKTGQKGNFLVKAIYFVRDKFEASLNRSLTEPYASFAAGLVLGSKRNIPDSLMSDFNRTGTTHIVAVSGYNVTIIIIYLGLILGLFSSRLRFWGSLFLILIFVVMTGAPASVIRAGILAGLLALGRYEGRRINILILLLLTAGLMLVFNPYSLKYDLSFELSFLAFVGLVYLGPIIATFKVVRFLPEKFKNILAETLGAQIMVLPILIYAFGRVSIISPIANILILWLIPTSMGVVFVVGICGLLALSLGQIAGYLGWLFLKYIIVIVETLSRIPWASWQWQTTDWWWMVIFYALISLIFIKFRNQEASVKKLDEKF